MKYLKPIYEGAKSFYGKAKIVEYENGNMELWSYDTLVLELKLGDEGWYYTLNYGIDYDLLFSKTTLRHIREFLKQYYKNVGWCKKDIIENAVNE